MIIAKNKKIIVHNLLFNTYSPDVYEVDDDPTQLCYNYDTGNLSVYCGDKLSIFNLHVHSHLNENSILNQMVIV